MKRLIAVLLLTIACGEKPSTPPPPPPGGVDSSMLEAVHRMSPAYADSVCGTQQECRDSVWDQNYIPDTQLNDSL